MAERYGRPIDPNPPGALSQTSQPPDLAYLSPMPSTPSSSLNTTAAAGLGPLEMGAPGAERIDSQVQKAQEQLLNLRRQQEQIERQKRELEELSRRQEELETGRSEMTEKLTRALVVLERQRHDAQKRVEQLHLLGESFSSHLNAIETIDPKSWQSADLQKELNRALGMVDHARTEYGQQRARFAADVAEGTAGDGAAAKSPYDEMFGDAGAKSFVYWLKAGVGFTLPLLLLGIVALFIFIWSQAAK